MGEPDDCDDPALARDSVVKDRVSREEQARKARRQFWICFWIGLPVGLAVCFYLRAATR